MVVLGEVLFEHLLGHGLVAERREGDLVGLGDGVESVDVVGVFVGVQAFDQGIEDSISQAERLDAAVDASFAGEGGFAVDADLEAALARLRGVGPGRAQAPDASLLAAVAADEGSPSKMIGDSSLARLLSAAAAAVHGRRVSPRLARKRATAEKEKEEKVEEEEEEEEGEEREEDEKAADQQELRAVETGPVSARAGHVQRGGRREELGRGGVAGGVTRGIAVAIPESWVAD